MSKDNNGREMSHEMFQPFREHFEIVVGIFLSKIEDK
jgi:hypothetical protein